MTVVYAILIFCVLIFVHEFGHFFTAKACGIQVNEFALGMGPAIFKKQKGETLYSLRIFPIGGYCAMEGEDEDSDNPRAFNNQPAWQRAIVLAAGALMNLLTCVVLLIIIAAVLGQSTTVLDKVASDSPAEKAGLLAGDRIVAVDGTEVKGWDDVIQSIGYSENKSVDVTIQRDGSEETITVPLEYNEEQKRNMIGITPATEHNALRAVPEGIKNTGQMTVLMYDTLRQLFTGGVSVKDLSGPVGIVWAVNETAKSGVIYVIYLAALLSLNLAVINLLPLPALDGGRLLFLVIRKVTGRRVTDEMEGRIHFIGIMLLFALMIYVTFNDVIRFVVPIF